MENLIKRWMQSGPFFPPDTLSNFQKREGKASLSFSSLVLRLINKAVGRRFWFQQEKISLFYVISSRHTSILLSKIYLLQASYSLVSKKNWDFNIAWRNQVRSIHFLPTPVPDRSCNVKMQLRMFLISYPWVSNNTKLL